MVVDEYTDVGWKTGSCGQRWDSNSKDVWETGDWMYQGEPYIYSYTHCYICQMVIFHVILLCICIASKICPWGFLVSKYISTIATVAS